MGKFFRRHALRSLGLGKEGTQGNDQNTLEDKTTDKGGRGERIHGHKKSVAPSRLKVLGGKGCKTKKKEQTSTAWKNSKSKQSQLRGRIEKFKYEEGALTQRATTT